MSENKSVDTTMPAVMLTIAFFIAKVAGGISWSWWWVFSPLWLPLALICCVAVIGGLIYMILLLCGAVPR